MENNKIIYIKDFILVSNGINKILNKFIKKVKLFYREGNNVTNFHSKCDEKSNTVTFVKTK